MFALASNHELDAKGCHFMGKAYQTSCLNQWAFCKMGHQPKGPSILVMCFGFFLVGVRVGVVWKQLQGIWSGPCVGGD